MSVCHVPPPEEEGRISYHAFIHPSVWVRVKVQVTVFGFTKIERDVWENYDNTVIRTSMWYVQGRYVKNRQRGLHPFQRVTVRGKRAGEWGILQQVSYRRGWLFATYITAAFDVWK